MHLYGLKSCDSCRAALKALPDASFVDIRNDGVPPDILAMALVTFPSSLINTRSTTWRGLDAETRQLAPDALLVAHPTLMKRPLIVDGDRMTVGWSKDVRSAYGLK